MKLIYLSFITIIFSLNSSADLYAQTHETVKDSVKNEAVSEVLPKLVKKQNVATNKYKDRLVVMKKLLKNIPVKDRMEFLNSLSLKNGRIVSAYMAPLRKNMDKDSLKRMVKIIFGRTENSKRISYSDKKESFRFVRLEELLKDIPNGVRNEFLDNMMFKDGALVTTYTGGIRKVVTDIRLKEILGLLATNINATPKTDNPKTLCFNGICDYSFCGLINDELRCKSIDADYSCDSSCSD